VTQGLNVVQAELFPDISIGDAPATPQATGGTGVPGDGIPGSGGGPLPPPPPFTPRWRFGNGAHP